MVNPRNVKLADQIKQIIAQTLDRRIKDPRLGFVTITEVRLSGDNQHATVFYTVLGDQKAREGSAAALESAKGHLRSVVGAGLGIRHTPSLEFVLDATRENVEEIENLLAKVQAADADIAKQAKEANYAGEADPYRQPSDEAK